MGVPLVLPHTSLTIPARSLHNLKNVFEIEKFTFIFCFGKRHSQGYAACLRPKNGPSSLCAIIISRNSQLSRVKPTCQWVNNPTLSVFCGARLGRADIEGSKSSVDQDSWRPQASYPCGNFSGTSDFELRT